MKKFITWLLPDIREKFVYELSLDEAKLALDQIFSKAGGLMEGPDFSAKFYTTHSFIMGSAIRGMPINSFNDTSLWGKLTSLGDNKTQIEIRIKPPSSFIFGLTLTSLIGLFGFGKGLIDASLKSIFSAMLLLVVPPFFIATSSKVKVERMYGRYRKYIHKVLNAKSTEPNNGLP